MEPILRFLRPFTMRQTAENHSRSALNSDDCTDSVCRVVSEYLMPYCIMLLQQLILPQKLSRRTAIVMLSERSGVACTSTGTLRPDKRIASTMPRSSPKLGRVTIMPSISSACFLNNSAQRCDSA